MISTLRSHSAYLPSAINGEGETKRIVDELLGIWTRNSSLVMEEEEEEGERSRNDCRQEEG